jgi:hypothetical protein
LGAGTTQTDKTFSRYFTHRPIYMQKHIPTKPTTDQAQGWSEKKSCSLFDIQHFSSQHLDFLLRVSKLHTMHLQTVDLTLQRFIGARDVFNQSFRLSGLAATVKVLGLSKVGCDFQI